MVSRGIFDQCPRDGDNDWLPSGNRNLFDQFAVLVDELDDRWGKALHDLPNNDFHTRYLSGRSSRPRRSGGPLCSTRTRYACHTLLPHLTSGSTELWLILQLLFEHFDQCVVVDLANGTWCTDWPLCSSHLRIGLDQGQQLTLSHNRFGKRFVIDCDKRCLLWCTYSYGRTAGRRYQPP